MATDTDLRIAELGLQAAAYRGLKGEISPIDNGVILEMLDGSLRDMTDPDNRRFEGTLTTADLHAPAFMGVWKGTVLTIDMPVTVVEPIGIAQVRPAAPGSLYYVDAADSVEVPAGDPRAAFRCYRPRLVIMITAPWKQSFDEWDASVGMTITWRET